MSESREMTEELFKELIGRSRRLVQSFKSEDLMNNLCSNDSVENFTNLSTKDPKIYGFSQSGNEEINLLSNIPKKSRNLNKEKEGKDLSLLIGKKRNREESTKK